MKKLFLTLLISLVAFSANAFDPKAKPVQVVMPFAPGGGVDQTFRHLQKYASQRGITMVGVYKPGAEGLISMSELATMPHDGYHVSVTTAAVVAYYRMRNPSFDIVPVTALRDSIMSVVVHPKSHITDLNMLERELKSGSKLAFGYGAPGQKLFLEQLFEFTRAKGKPLLVPYKGGGPVVNDLLGGHIDVAVVPYAIVKSHISAGRLKLITASSRDKISGLNTTPIQTKFPGWKSFDGFAFVVESNTDKEAVKFWQEFLREYMNDPQVQADFVAEGTVLTPYGTKYLTQTINASITRLERTK